MASSYKQEDDSFSFFLTKLYTIVMRNDIENKIISCADAQDFVC